MVMLYDEGADVWPRSTDFHARLQSAMLTQGGAKIPLEACLEDICGTLKCVVAQALPQKNVNKPYNPTRTRIDPTLNKCQINYKQALNQA